MIVAECTLPAIVRRLPALLSIGLFAACAVVLLVPAGSVSAASQAGGPQTKWHYAPNSNFNSQGIFLPGSLNFTVADVDNPKQLDALRNDKKNPGYQKALVWLGRCSGATASFRSDVTSFEKSKYRDDILAYFLTDEPDPTGKWHHPKCTAASLKAESDWIHKNTRHKTFITMMNMSSNKSPTFKNTYKPSNTGIDYYGIDPYPCRTELKGCAFSEIRKHVKAAVDWGIPRDRIVPVYQAFGGGTYVTDGDGKYFLPSVGQTKKIFSYWQQETPNPPFDFAYSWGVQEKDKPLSKSSKSLKNLYKLHNKQN